MRIALLSYRSKPHCGGQGVYVRHLSRELVALGHDVEVLSGQPYPVLDPGVRLTEVPSLDLYREPDPFRTPRPGEIRDLTDVLEVARLVRLSSIRSGTMDRIPAGHPRFSTLGPARVRLLANGGDYVDTRKRFVAEPQRAARTGHGPLGVVFPAQGTNETRRWNEGRHELCAHNPGSGRVGIVAAGAYHLTYA